jgi:gamma-glutamylcyclotransferase (GGCT)/AIG2-like uncharacterized protein YtfP
MPKVFVYGTLKPGEAAHEQYCAPYLKASQPAWMRGLLFHLPEGYPALTVGDRWVAGALLQLRDEAAIARMDAFEDYDPTLPDADNLYVRRSRPVFSANHQSLGTAWVYLMAPERVTELGGIAIPSGVWSGQQWPSIKVDVTPDF